MKNQLINLKRKFKFFLRKKISSEYKKRYKNKNITIISQNCLGGIMYHDLGLQFTSPTINMFFEGADFIKFLKKPDYYLNAKMSLTNQCEYNYPVIQLADIKLHCVHYKDFNQVRDEWKKRVKRINKDNMFIIMTQRDGCTKKDIIEFDSLNYKNKIIFVNKPMPNIKSACYIKETKRLNTEEYVTDLSQYTSFFSGKRYIDYFDWVSFLNGTSKYNK